MTDELAGRTLLVTGGSRGIGRAIVEAAAARGARVAYCSRAPEDAPAIAGALAVRADVSREDDVAELFDRVGRALGPPEVVVSNAGVNRQALLVSSDTSLLDDLLAVNLTGSFLVARAAVRAFAGRGGRLVFMGSIQENGSPRGASAYAASKGGLRGLVRAFARDYAAEGVSATLLVTGLVDTELTRELPAAARERVVGVCPLRRLPSIEEVAGLALFLASDAAVGLSGGTLRAAGGMLEMLA